MQEELLKELIKAMELRAASFECNRNFFILGDAQYAYWDGKRSEAQFMVDKLTWILDNGRL